MVDKTPAQIKAEEEQKRKDQETRTAAQKSAGGGRTVPGAMSTYSDASQQSGLPQDPRGPDRGFKHDEVKQFVGDIQRGELAHLELDENGTPTGVAFREIPERDQVTAVVYGTPKVEFDDLVTPTGAPITKFMNPEPTLWDAGMLARNPPPKMSEEEKKRPLIGGGVINQPVTA